MLLPCRVVMFWCKAAALAAVTLCISLGYGQQQPRDLTQISLEELANMQVYSASKHMERASEAPSSVSVVTGDEIRKYGYRTLADVLRSLRGFFIIGDHEYSYVGVRGFAPHNDLNTRILLLVNGHRLNDDVKGSALVGTEFPVDIDLIERIEVVRGPSASLYGNNAFFGVINVITRKPADFGTAEVSSSVGSFGTYRERVSVAQQFHNGLDMLFSGTFFNSHGHDRLYFPEYDAPATNDGIAENVDHDQSRNFLADISFRHFRLLVMHGTRARQSPVPSMGGAFNDPRSYLVDQESFAELSYERTIRERWNFRSSVSFNRSGFVLQAPYAFPGGSVLDQAKVIEEWVGADAQVSRKVRGRQNITAGVELHDAFREDGSRYDVTPYRSYIDLHQDSNFWAVYLQDEIRLHRMISLHAGVRYDRFSQFGGTANPRLGVIVHPFQATTVKLLYGHAFRAPTLNEFMYNNFFTTPAVASPKPEKMRSLELVVEQKLGKHFSASASAYRYVIHDLIDNMVQPDGSVYWGNAQRVHARGLELEVEGQWLGGLKFRTSYTLQNLHQEMVQTEFQGAPKHLAKANLSVPLWRRNLFGSVEAQFTGKRPDDASALGSFMLVNTTLYSRRVVKGLEGSVSVYNLLGRKYFDPANPGSIEFIPQDGRSLGLKLTYSFGGHNK